MQGRTVGDEMTVVTMKNGLPPENNWKKWYWAYWIGNRDKGRRQSMGDVEVWA